MQDRASAAVFGKIFKLLAKNPTEERKNIAAEIMTVTHEYDFTSDQMHCDDALISLDLARNGIDPRYPEDGVTLLYGPLK